MAQTKTRTQQTLPQMHRSLNQHLTSASGIITGMREHPDWPAGARSATAKKSGTTQTKRSGTQPAGKGKGGATSQRRGSASG